MACFKSTITNNLSQISVYQYKRCSDAAFISNVELRPNQTVDVWYIDDSLQTAFQSQFISPPVGWPPVSTTFTCSNVIIRNNNSYKIAVSFRDCCSNLINVEINPRTTFSPAYCISDGFKISGATGNSIITKRPCSVFTPPCTPTPSPEPASTTTPTPSVTTTPTPTFTPPPSGPCNCLRYQFENTNSYPVTIDYVECIIDEWAQYSLNSGLTESFCLCENGYIAPSGVNVTLIGPSNCGGSVTNTPTPTNTTTPTNTPTQTVTPTNTTANTETPTPTPTITPTQTVTPTNTETPTVTPTQTVTPTNTETPTQTVTPTNTETPTQTVTPSNTETPTPTPTPTNTETPTPTPTYTTTPTPTPTNPCNCETYEFNLSYTDVLAATGNTNNNGYVYAEFPICEKSCGGTSQYWATSSLLASMNSGQTYTFQWCMPMTGSTYIGPGNTRNVPWYDIYLYQDNVKVTGVTSTITATTQCCNTGSSSFSGKTSSYLLRQTPGTLPAQPSTYGDLVFFNDVVTNNVDSLTGFSMNNFDVISGNTNGDTCQSLSGLTIYGGQVSFTQNGYTAIFSGSSSSYQTNLTGFTGNSLTLIQSANTTFNSASTVFVSYLESGNPFKGATGLTDVNSCTLWVNPSNRIDIFRNISGEIINNVTTLYYDVNLSIPVSSTYVSDGFNSYLTNGVGLITNTSSCP